MNIDFANDIDKLKSNLDLTSIFLFETERFESFDQISKKLEDENIREIFKQFQTKTGKK